MKRVNFFIALSLTLSNIAFCQKIPVFVQQRLNSLHDEAKVGLTMYRYGYSPYSPFDHIPPNLLRYSFSNKEVVIIDSLKLNLNIGMIYDDEMRNRIIQLLRNEYSEDELDTLVNRFIEFSSLSIMREAFVDCKFDTLQVFKESLDNFYTNIINKNPEDSAMLRKYEYVEKNKYKYDVFKLLQLDTTTLYKQSCNKIIEKEKEWKLQDLLNSTSYYSDYIFLAELCGYINDKRFIQPLIEVLNIPFDSNSDPDLGLEVDSTRRKSVHKKVIETLARMRVEPYYSDYVKKRTLTLEQIKKEYPGFDIQDLVYVLRTQESFLELSKYLLSEVAYSWNVPDLPPGVERKETPNPMYSEALSFIRDHIENKDLQEILDIPNWWANKGELKKPTYDWMQKNYGKYKIKRIW